MALALHLSVINMIHAWKGDEQNVLDRYIGKYGGRYVLVDCLSPMFSLVDVTFVLVAAAPDMESHPFYT